MTEVRLDGRVALVTGAGRGLGRAHARLLAAHGARVVVNDPGVGLGGEGGDQAPARDVVAEIEAAGGSAVANFDTVATEDGARAMIRQAIDSFGRIDIVVNNAGNFYTRHGFDETSPESFAHIWQVHVIGSVNVIRAAWPHMVAQKYGRIINTASHTGYLGSRNNLEYSAAKAAIHGITRTLSLEAGDHNIAVNAIAPGAVTRPVRLIPGILDMMPAGAFEPELVAPTVVWLAHEDCKVTGEIFGVMAGTTTRIKVVETPGYCSRNPTPEAIRDAFEDVILDQRRFDAAGLVIGKEAELRGMDLVERFTAS
ncbi:SDR family NAD(P)-dependent oxidoreductase [Rhizorhabdus dicambivorans]|uniref:SDR family NAD(P)-dependent oxidoreductase n=1 Tax=Rhizorhabdus dicambivorans TaxID=1850238 RepID=UPI00159670C0|nr:SDR family NAD(P)-dependent oxidoreductase [Rhizorhabdus dicambivorans]